MVALPAITNGPRDRWRVSGRAFVAVVLQCRHQGERHRHHCRRARSQRPVAGRLPALPPCRRCASRARTRPPPMLPALAVTTPCARVSGGAARIALPAPRSLNEPIGWRFSSLSQISAGASMGSRRSGVRVTRPARVRRAASISPRVGASSGGRVPIMREPSWARRSGAKRLVPSPAPCEARGAPPPDPRWRCRAT